MFVEEELDPEMLVIYLETGMLTKGEERGCVLCV